MRSAIGFIESLLEMLTRHPVNTRGVHQDWDLHRTQFKKKKSHEWEVLTFPAGVSDMKIMEQRKTTFALVRSAVV